MSTKTRFLTKEITQQKKSKPRQSSRPVREKMLYKRRFLSKHYSGHSADVFALIEVMQNCADGYCWLSYATMAEELCISRITVQRHLAPLRQDDLIYNFRGMAAEERDSRRTCQFRTGNKTRLRALELMYARSLSDSWYFLFNMSEDEQTRVADALWYFASQRSYSREIEDFLAEAIERFHDPASDNADQ